MSEEEKNEDLFAKISKVMAEWQKTTNKFTDLIQLPEEMKKFADLIQLSEEMKKLILGKIQPVSEEVKKLVLGKIQPISEEMKKFADSIQLSEEMKKLIAEWQKTMKKFADLIQLPEEMMKEIKIKAKEIKLPVVGDLLKCSVCKRKILVERALIGTNHTTGIFVTCWDCLTEEEKEKAKKQYKLE